MKLLGSLLVGPGFFVTQTFSDALRDCFFWSASLTRSIQHSGDLRLSICVGVTFLQIWAVMLGIAVLRRRVRDESLKRRADIGDQGANQVGAKSTRVDAGGR